MSRLAGWWRSSRKRLARDVMRIRGRYTGRALEDASPTPPAENAEKTLDPVTLDKNRVFKAVGR